MSYLHNNLSSGENIVYQANIHWFIFVRPVLLVFFGYLFYSALETGFIHWIGIILLVLGAFSLFKRLFIRIGSLYVVTNKRLILKSGIIKRDALELLLNKCEGIRISQGIWGRIAGFGTLIVTTGGATNSYRYVADPIKFRKEIDGQIP
ncbi:MAG: PH domain-containing protein [Draconibacterium sp.]